MGIFNSKSVENASTDKSEAIYVIVSEILQRLERCEAILLDVQTDLKEKKKQEKFSEFVNKNGLYTTKQKRI